MREPTDILLVADEPLSRLPKSDFGDAVRLHVAGGKTPNRVRGLHPDIVIVVGEISDEMKRVLEPILDKSPIVVHHGASEAAKLDLAEAESYSDYVEMGEVELE